MSKCYIPEISTRKINSENVSKLKNNFSHNKYNKKFVCGPDGFYELKANTISKFVTIIQNEMIFENFIDKNTLIVSNQYDKKIGDTEYIPFESNDIHIEYICFDIPESNNKFVLEFFNNRCRDFYFQTKDKIKQNNVFLNNDVSLILKTLNV
tara:strand:+ start:4975 stop:5430 length:456 start_codon:yes stop_codon:yes gene_type:complete